MATKFAKATITTETKGLDERRINRLRARLEARRYRELLSFFEGEIQITPTMTLGTLVKRAAGGWEGNPLNREMTFQEYLMRVIEKLNR